MHSLRQTLKRFLGIAVISVCGQSTVVASDYSSGLSAYIMGDYAMARQYWLKAANNKDAKSMFNLGLLHEQNKIQNADIDKALNWYRLAADNGYAAAAYHLGQRTLERGGSDESAISLLRQAAMAGYAPAKRYLKLNKLAVAIDDHINRGDVKVSTPALTTEYNSESWINRQHSQNWTIQLLAFKQKEQVQRFIQQHGLISTAAYFIEISGTERYYKLVYGSFKSKEQAELARQSLPSSLSEYGPWLRTWASVQKITKR